MFEPPPKKEVVTGVWLADDARTIIPDTRSAN